MKRTTIFGMGILLAAAQAQAAAIFSFEASPNVGEPDVFDVAVGGTVSVDLFLSFTDPDLAEINNSDGLEWLTATVARFIDATTIDPDSSGVFSAAIQSFTLSPEFGSPFVQPDPIGTPSYYTSGAYDANLNVIDRSASVRYDYFLGPAAADSGTFTSSTKLLVGTIVFEGLADGETLFKIDDNGDSDTGLTIGNASFPPYTILYGTQDASVTIRVDDGGISPIGIPLPAAAIPGGLLLSGLLMRRRRQI